MSLDSLDSYCTTRWRFGRKCVFLGSLLACIIWRFYGVENEAGYLGLYVLSFGLVVLLTAALAFVCIMQKVTTTCIECLAAVCIFGGFATLFLASLVTLPSLLFFSSAQPPPQVLYMVWTASSVIIASFAVMFFGLGCLAWHRQQEQPAKKAS